MSSQTKNRMADVLKWAAEFKVPQKFGRVQIPWDDMFAVSKELRLDEEILSFKPCEALVADDAFGSEVQHHDGLLGTFDNNGFLSAWGTGHVVQSHGYNTMQALVAPNLAPPIRTQIVTKVKTTDMTRICQLWGALQHAVGKAVTDCYEHKFFPDGAEDLYGLIVGVFVFPGAGTKEGKPLEGEAMEKHMHALYCLGYAATVVMLYDAVTGGLSAQERVERAKTTNHPFMGFKWAEAS